MIVQEIMPYGQRLEPEAEAYALIETVGDTDVLSDNLGVYDYKAMIITRCLAVIGGSGLEDRGKGILRWLSTSGRESVLNRDRSLFEAVATGKESCVRQDMAQYEEELINRALGASMITEDFMEQMELVERCLDEAQHMPRWLTHEGAYAHPPYFRPYEALKPAPVQQLGPHAIARLGEAGLQDAVTHWSLTCDIRQREGAHLRGLYVAGTTVHAGIVNQDGIFEARQALTGPLTGMHREEI